MHAPPCEALVAVAVACLVVNATRKDGDTLCSHRLRPAVRWVEATVPHGDLVVAGLLHGGAHLFLRHLVRPLRA